MAKWNRTVIGSVVKGKEGKPDYIQISNDVILKKGDYLNLESKKTQLESAESAIKAGKLAGDAQAAVLERINKMPDFVRFHIVRIEKQSD